MYKALIRSNFEKANDPIDEKPCGGDDLINVN
jgi:hypothetical protein